MAHTPSPKNYVVRVKAGLTDVSLPGVGTAVAGGTEIEMSPLVFTHMSPTQLAAVDVIQVASDGTITPDQLNALTTDAEMAAALAALPAPPAGVFTPNADNTAIVPLDISDSWIVGSDRMAQDTADTAGAKAGRAFFYKAKAAFRAGRAEGAQWNDINIGDYSYAEGFGTTSSGVCSHAEGANSIASGNQAHAEGLQTQATGAHAHAEGGSTIASGGNSHAEGSSTKASGPEAHAEGFGTTASGAVSHAEGASTTASGSKSHAEGEGTTASGFAAHAEGVATTASGNASHAEGLYAVASRLHQYAKGPGQFAARGDAQIGSMVLLRSTTDAVATVLTVEGGLPVLTGASTNVLTLPASRAFQLKISTVARRTDVQGEMAGFTWEGLVGRDATGNARVIGTPVTNKWSDTAAAAYAVAVSIDTITADNYVAVTVTGEAAKTIRWVAKMEWVEVAG